MNKTILVTAAVMGFLAVILGAFGAHGLKRLVDANAVSTFETGVRYQMYHALLLLFVGSTAYLTPNAKNWVFYSVLIGVVLFSGSIYGLATNTLTTFDFKKAAFLTPIGGLFLIIGWLLLAYHFLTIKTK